MVSRPIPFMEGPALTTNGPAHRQGRRRDSARDIAFALLGRRAELAQDDNGYGILVDADSGELVDGGPGEARAERFAALLLQGSQENNHFSGILTHNERPFEAGGAIVSPSLRLDPNWCEVLRRRSRKVARAAIARVKAGLSPKEAWGMRRKFNWRLSWKMVTLTMPHLEGVSTESELIRLNDALRRLGKSAIWAKVHGGVKGVENALKPSGPHVHAHLLLLARHLDMGELRAAWWKALDSATRASYGRRLEHMPGGLPFIDIRKVTKKGTGEGEVSPDDALNEVCKYITTPEDYTAPDEDGRTIPGSVLLELCEIQHWPRMFELLGAARKPRTAQRAQLDTSCISAAGAKLQVPLWLLREALEGAESWLSEAIEPEERRKPPEKVPRPPTWRQLMETETLGAWLRIMSGRARRARAWRLEKILERNPDGVIATLDGKVYMGSNYKESLDEM